jgi:hypothetical protein
MSKQKKLIVTQIVKKSCAFYGTLRFITVFIRAHLRPCVTFHNKPIFYGKDLLAPCPTSRLEDHPLSTWMHNCIREHNVNKTNFNKTCLSFAFGDKATYSNAYGILQSTNQQIRHIFTNQMKHRMIIMFKTRGKQQSVNKLYTCKNHWNRATNGIKTENLDKNKPQTDIKFLLWNGT